MPSRASASYIPSSASSRVNRSPLLSNVFVPDLSTAGYVIGTLTLNRTPVGATTFSEVADPDSKFTVVGSELRLSASVNHAVAKSHRYQGSRLTRRPAAGRWLNPIPCLPIPSLLLRLIALKSCSLFKGFPCQTLMKS